MSTVARAVLFKDPVAADSTEYPKEFIEGFELSDEVLKELRGDEVESAATGFPPCSAVYDYMIFPTRILRRVSISLMHSMIYFLSLDTKCDTTRSTACY